MHAFHVRKGKDKSFWTRIGAAWPHEDGNGFNIKLDCVPVDGSIVLRSADEDEAGE